MARGIAGPSRGESQATLCVGHGGIIAGLLGARMRSVPKCRPAGYSANQGRSLNRLRASITFCLASSSNFSKRSVSSLSQGYLCPKKYLVGLGPTVTRIASIIIPDDRSVSWTSGAPTVGTNVVSIFCLFNSSANALAAASRFVWFGSGSAEPARRKYSIVTPSNECKNLGSPGRKSPAWRVFLKLPASFRMRGEVACSSARFWRRSSSVALFAFAAFSLALAVSSRATAASFSNCAARSLDSCARLFATAASNPASVALGKYRQAVALYQIKVIRSLDGDIAELFYVQTDELIARGTPEEVEKVLARLIREAAQHEGTDGR